MGRDHGAAALAEAPEVAPGATLVEAAQRGDTEAFAALVERYSRYVLALASQRLHDRAEAEDIAQETFLEVYRCLPRLREPEAFTSWLRLITIKQIDRALRSRRFTLASLEETPEAASLPAQEEDIEASIVRSEGAQIAHLALTRLPPGVRDVMELFYLGGHSQGQVAAALQAPLSTIKKRLHDGRARLRQEILALERDGVDISEATGAPAVPGLITRVAFFTAIHDGDVLRAERLLSQHPDLVMSSEDWTEALANLYDLGLPSKAYPLHQVAALGHLALVRCLLRHHAPIDATIASGLTALHMATLHSRPAVVALLLRAGANPTCRSLQGLTPLHWAAMRGDDDCARLLLAAGAPVDARDASGRTPADWAAMRASRLSLAPVAAPRDA